MQDIIRAFSGRFFNMFEFIILIFFNTSHAWQVRKIVDLTKLSLTSTYCKWQGNFHEQKEGQAMGSPLSPVTSNIFMEHFQIKTLDTYSLKPVAWFRFVDDTFTGRRHGKNELANFLDNLNSQHDNIRYYHGNWGRRLRTLS